MDNKWALKCIHMHFMITHTHIPFARVLWVDYCYIGMHLLCIAPSATATCWPIYTTTPTETLSVGKTGSPHVLFQGDWQVWQEYYCPTTLTYCQVDSGERVCSSCRQQPTTLRCSLATHHLSYQHVCGRTVGFSYHRHACALLFLCNTILGFSTQQTKIHTIT